MKKTETKKSRATVPLSAATCVVKMRLGIKQHNFYTVVSNTGRGSVHMISLYQAPLVIQQWPL
jgi:hypothetical protein